MKLHCLIVTLVCSLGTFCFAQQSTQVVTRSLPVRLNSTTTPPGISPQSPGLPSPMPAQRPLHGIIPPPPQPVAAPAPLAANILAWDSESKDYDVKQGEMQAQFTFYFTNISASNVIIHSAAASCGCTVPKMPALPWTNAPGTTGEIPVAMQLAGKSGTVFKTITINTDHGPKVLTVKAVIPTPGTASVAPVSPVAPAGPMDRNKNQELAKADRQAVFKGDCASCHVEPAKGRFGKDLYDKACGICHEAEHRATMVPDLHALNHDTNADFWKTWTSQGKPGTLMPAFALSEGGPLTDAQINSLVQYLTTTMPAHPVKSAAAN